MAVALVRTNNTIDARIDEWIELGTVPFEDAGDTTTLLECARRYIEWECARRARQSVRTSERAALMRIEADDKLREAVKRVTEKMAESISVAWTAELLESSFSVGGETITWADADADDHDARATKLEAFAAGDMKTAALHRAAATAIRESGLRSLREVTGVAIAG